MDSQKVDASLDMKREVDNSQNKYVLGLFLETSGAFDLDRWTAIFRVLRVMEMSK